MNTKEILENLSALNDELKRKNIFGELTIYGGAVMCLCFNARPSTKDIDGWFEPKAKIYEAVAAVARSKNLSSDWLNDAVKGFISKNDDVCLYKEFSNLKIYRPKDEYQLAMKLMSCRLGINENDEEDIVFLIKRIGVKNVEEAEDIITKYFPESMILPKTHFFLMEIMDKINIQANSELTSFERDFNDGPEL